jgi:TfoX/Sxy family transcriptional regulator of competence genes
MAYSEKLADRIREALVDVKKVKEKKMFRGIVFMVNDKMCINVSHDDLMCRIDPALHAELVERNGCRTVVMRGREMKGYVYVSEEGMRSKKDFDFWIGLCLNFNKRAKSSKKKKSI